MGVLVNQIAAAVSFRRYRARYGAVGAVRTPGPFLRPVVVGLPGIGATGPVLHLGLTISGW